MLTFLVSIRQYIALRDYGRLAVRYQQLASIDGTTGLFNRRHFMETAETAFAHAQRLGQPVVALMIDVDNFKQINDLHGHIAGDEVLIDLARACREHVRPEDIVGRYGGDEFIIIVPGITSLRAIQLADQLTHRVTNFHGSDGKPLAYNSSVGIAECPPYDDLTTLLMHADRAMYDGEAGRRRRLAYLRRRCGRRTDGHRERTPPRRQPGLTSIDDLTRSGGAGSSRLPVRRRVAGEPPPPAPGLSSVTFCLVELRGFEPLTPCMQGRCATTAP